MNVLLLRPLGITGLSSSMIISKNVDFELSSLTLNRPGGSCPQAGSSLSCANTVSGWKLKLCAFYYILIGCNYKYKSVTNTSTAAMITLLLKSAWYRFD